MADLMPRNSPETPKTGICRPEIPRSPYRGEGKNGEIFGGTLWSDMPMLEAVPSPCRLAHKQRGKKGMCPRDGIRALCFDDLTNPMARAYCRDLAAYLMGRAVFDGGLVLHDTLKLSAAHEAGHAVIATALGSRIESAAICECGAGMVAPADGDELGQGYEFSNLPRLAKTMCVLAAGYVGEQLLHGPVEFAAPHEMGVVLYQAQIIGTHHGITATAAIRATLNFCGNILTRKKAVAMALVDALEARHYLTGVEVGAILAGVERCGVDDWLSLARQGGGPEHPKVERMLRFANIVSQAGHQAYAECYPLETIGAGRG